MVVPVVFGQSTFDYTPLRTEQSRLAKTLVVPSPRDKDDTAATLEIEDDQASPFKYPTFIKVRYDKEGTLPVFELWTKDNFDQEYKVSKENYDAPVGAAGGTIQLPPYVLHDPNVTPANDAAFQAAYQIRANVGAATQRQGINDDPLIAGNLYQSEVNNSYAVNSITGDVYRNAYWDHVNRVIRDSAGLAETAPGFAGERIGTVKFDGVTGLALAAVNTRIADISNAVEGITKVLSVSSQNLDSVINLVR